MKQGKGLMAGVRAWLELGFCMGYGWAVTGNDSGPRGLARGRPYKTSFWVSLVRERATLR